MNVLELIVFIGFISLLFTVVSLAIKLKVDNIKLKKDVNQGLADQFVLMEKLDEAFRNTDKEKIEETEGFLKFVSESRDWAFQYIERVQISIKEFQDVFHPLAEKYYKEKKRSFNQQEFGKIFEAYRKLVDELPDEGKSK